MHYKKYMEYFAVSVAQKQRFLSYGHACFQNRYLKLVKYATLFFVNI